MVKIYIFKSSLKCGKVEGNKNHIQGGVRNLVLSHKDEHKENAGK